MTDPIDIIDLTVDSPVVPKTLRLRSINIDTVSNNSTTSQLQDSIIEIVDENICNKAQSTEIIDLDNVNLPKNINIYRENNYEPRSEATLICAICLEQLYSDMKPMCTRCGHIFCEHCLQLALRVSKKCPTCKRVVKIQTCTRLHF